MSIKKLQREIMLSAVYQLSTADDKEASAKDSGDRLYWRASRKRMDAEELRDSVLEAAGDLDDSIGGPSKDLTPDYHRRTVYGRRDAVRQFPRRLSPAVFDFPPPNISAEKRFTTTVPLQRLFLMNSDFVQLEAEKLYTRAAAEPDRPRANPQTLRTCALDGRRMNLEIQDRARLSADGAAGREDTRKQRSGEKEKRRRSKKKKEAEKSEAAAVQADATRVMPKTDVAEAASDMASSRQSHDAAAGCRRYAPEETEAAAPADPNADMGMAMMAGAPGARKGGHRLKLAWRSSTTRPNGAAMRNSC